MSPAARLAGIARHLAEAPDPLGFDALRLDAITAAQQASGELWTDYNLHDPGVSLLEALCFALTEDLFAARQPIAELMGLAPDAGPAAWARFGMHTPRALLPCHPCTERDWQSWLLQQLPHARQLRMQALRDDRGRATGLWRMTLQSHADAPEDQHALRSKALRAWWPRRNLGEDLDGPPGVLRSRWVELEVSLQLEGRRDVCDLLAELLQRCDDSISARPPEGLPPTEDASPDVEGPLGRALTAAESNLLDQDPEFLFVSDLARDLQDMPGLAAIDTLRLHLVPGEPEDPLDDVPTPPGSVRRRGRDWALRLRWPDHEEQLHRWRLTREGGPVQVPARALLQMLADQRRLPLRMASASTIAMPGAALDEPLPPLPALRRDHYPASAALPPLYQQALLDHARQRPGLRAQWHGYLGLLEHGLNQVQVQREQLPRLYALDEDTLRSCWTSMPGDEQLPGIEALYEQPRERLEAAPWVDEDPLARRHRVLNYQLALHGEGLDHSGLQALPCYFTPPAWPVHLLRLKRRFARRLLRLGRDRGAGADLSQPVLGQPDNTPPLQERMGLKLGLAQTHSRWLSGTWRSQGLPAPEEWPAPRPESAPHPHYEMRAPDETRLLLNPVVRRRDIDWPRLRQAMPAMRDALPAPLLRAAVRPELFQWAPEAGGRLWLGPDEQGRHWLLAHGAAESAAQELARSLHEAACHLQAAGEGLHLVEHLLLRPLQAPADGAPRVDDRAGAQVSLVFSGWTARGADLRFRMLAEQILAREAPAHLRCRLVWLDAGQMQAFEAAWHAWLTARAAHCAALLASPAQQEAEAAARALDERSARVRDLLQEVAS
jgi:hypothetical protein